MDNIFLRTELLIGEEKLNILKNACVWVFGIGGVGGCCAECLVRSGIGNIYIVDKDVVDITNINRQIIATTDTIGHDKVSVFKTRALSINPDIKINAIHKAFMIDNQNEFDFSGAHYIVDAIDMVTAKIALIEKAKKENINIISSMGTGNKLDATKFKITDIYNTRTDPLARVMRRELRKRSISDLKVVYSTDEPIKQGVLDSMGKPITASAPWVPPVAGFLIAGEVIKDIIGLFEE